MQLLLALLALLLLLALVLLVTCTISTPGPIGANRTSRKTTRATGSDKSCFYYVRVGWATPRGWGIRNVSVHMHTNLLPIHPRLKHKGLNMYEKLTKMNIQRKHTPENASKHPLP